LKTHEPKLLLIGAGGHGKVAAEIAELSDFKEIYFIDPAYPGKKQNGPWAVIGNMEDIDALKRDNYQFHISIGLNTVREKVFTEINQPDYPVLTHPGATISKYASLGSGTIAIAGAIINTDTKVGKGVILNTGCTIDHDCTIGDFAHISPGANVGGGCTIGERTWVGIGASIKHSLKIGKDVTIGAGAVVVNDIPDGTTVIGCPARPI